MPTVIRGNPPEAMSDVLGLVLPAGRSPLDETWGAVVTWQETGHVSDKDARTGDHDEAPARLREGEAAERTAHEGRLPRAAPGRLGAGPDLRRRDARDGVGAEYRL